MTSNDKQEYAVFSVCNLAYLPRTLVLAESILKYNNIQLNIYLFDRKVNYDFSSVAANIFWIEDMGIPAFYQLAFKYDIVELSTSLKPYITLKLLEQYKKVVFFDPDVCLYNSAGPILNDLDKHAIILTPHYTTPLSSHGKDGWNNDLGMMRFGSFNLGFFAVRNSPQGLDFLRWWSDRCMQLGFMESQFGLSTDQKWISLAPCLFQDLHVSFNLGYNVAPWNIFERSIRKTLDGGYIVNDHVPLIFFHFSNFDDSDPEYLKETSWYKQKISCPALLELSTNYSKALSANKLDITQKKYGFDYMSGGEYISPTLRRAYACILNELNDNHDPFDSQGVVGDFARKNYLFETKTKVEPKKTKSFQDIGVHKTKLKFIYFLMRMVLRVIGPNRFYDLSRLMVFLSSYRQNRGLWK